MPEPDDIALLKEYAESGSEPAFTTLVGRHVNLVYSAALRSAGNTHAAEEIAQAVFIILARKAGKMPQHTVLSGWLYQTARLTAANYLRGEIRRQNREQEAFMQTILSGGRDASSQENWSQIAPLLDDAMGRLGEKDRNAIVLRFFENKNLAEVGAALGASEDAAKMRVNRALDKLRKIFSKRGVTHSDTVIAGAVSAHSVHAAPAVLAKTISAVAIAKGSIASASILTLVKGTLKIMAYTKFKMAIGIAAGILLAGGATTIFISGSDRDSKTRPGNDSNVAVQDKMAVPEIIKQSQDAYAALTSYSDEGQTVSFIGTRAVSPTTFTIKLARPNLYRIEWSQNMGFYAQTGIVWSAGSGDFTIMSSLKQPRKNANMEMTLSGATGVSGDAAASAPGTFFKMNWGNELGAAMQTAKRMPDEKVGGVDCYVLTQSKGGRTQTLWIGEQDHLIRQIESDTSAADLKTTLEAVAKKNPSMRLPTSVAGDSKSVETHSNIVVNQKFSPSDFAP